MNKKKRKEQQLKFVYVNEDDPTCKDFQYFHFDTTYDTMIMIE